jgi:hypothetical protein
MPASRTRGHKVKSDICRSGILTRLPTSALVKPRWEPMFNEILYEMQFKELPPHKQCVAIMFAKCFCSIADLWDFRGVIKETDYHEKLVQLNDLDGLVTLLLKLFDKLNAGTNSGKEKKEPEKKEPELDIGQKLQELLSTNAQS